MTRRLGGTTVKPGFYWNSSTWQIAIIDEKPGPLPGGAEERFVKVPAVGVMALAPAMGLAMVIMLPFLGFAAVAAELGRRGTRALRHMAGKLTA